MLIRECPICGSPDVKKRKGAVTRKIRGKIHTLHSILFWECRKCGERLYPADSVHEMEKQLGHTPVVNLPAK